MATLTVIVGLCGSGKTTVLRRMAAAFPQAQVMDEGFVLPGNDVDRAGRAAVIAGLRSGRPCIVTSLECANEGNRVSVMRHVQAEAPGTLFLWLVFENDLEKANRTCRCDPDRQAAVEGRVRINNHWSAGYTIPPDAIVLKMHEFR